MAKLTAQDIVERLREADANSQQRTLGSRIFGEAADTISRLTADNEVLRKERDSTERVASLIDEGLGILNSLADSIRRHGNYSPESTCMFIDQAGQAFREARRAIAGGTNG